MESKRLALNACILVSAPPSFEMQLESLCRASLAFRIQQSKPPRNDDSMEEDEDENLADIFTNETQLFDNLTTLGWLRPEDGLLQRPLSRAIRFTVLQIVKETIQGDLESENLFPSVQEQVQVAVKDWDTRIPVESWTDLTAHFFCQVRRDEIFEVVADYPDSHAAVKELHSLLTADLLNDLGQALRQALIRRLNHPGAETSQIIDVYINTIKVLRVLDPSDRLLAHVAEPVRQYLRGRSDTVRCIITSLTSGDLYEELRRQDAKLLEHVVVDSDDEDEEPGMDWQPPPSIFARRGSFLESSNAEGDILAMLVSIYGSKQLFVNEYRLMLADKLLANVDYNTDKEVHTLELLKLRFGEASMRNCEVMIKDMDDSKRANTHIHEELKLKGKEPVVDAAMISHIFWPTLQKESLKHHSRIQDSLDDFSTSYGRLKNPRQLIWMQQLGMVDLELDVVEDHEDGSTSIETREFSCSPLLATLILHFEDKTVWTAEELSNETGIPEHAIQKRMTYWTNNRVVRLDSKGKYELASAIHESHEEIEEGDDSHAVSVTAHEEEEMAVYESYIVGMLTNMGQLPLQRIHSLLKTFVTGSDVRYDKSPQQLSVFLQHLCRSEKLECGPDGMYKLFKK